jgi:hypothetical protein
VVVLIAPKASWRRGSGRAFPCSSQRVVRDTANLLEAGVGMVEDGQGNYCTDFSGPSRQHFGEDDRGTVALGDSVMVRQQGTVGAGVLLGLLVLAVVGCGEKPRPEKDEPSAVQKVKQLDGRVTMDSESPGEPVVGVNIDLTNLTDPDLAVNAGAVMARSAQCRSPIILRWITRTTVLRCLGLPTIMVVGKAGRTDIYSDAGVSFDYDSNDRLIRVSCCRVPA